MSTIQVYLFIAFLMVYIPLVIYYQPIIVWRLMVRRRAKRIARVRKSIQVYMAALSNNLPILMNELKKVRTEQSN